MGVVIRLPDKSNSRVTKPDENFRPVWWTFYRRPRIETNSLASSGGNAIILDYSGFPLKSVDLQDTPDVLNQTNLFISLPV